MALFHERNSTDPMWPYGFKSPGRLFRSSGYGFGVVEQVTLIYLTWMKRELPVSVERI